MAVGHGREYRGEGVGRAGGEEEVDGEGFWGEGGGEEGREGEGGGEGGGY